MSSLNKLTNMIEQQKSFLAEMETEAVNLLNSDIVKENETLRAESERLRAALNGSEDSLKEYAARNAKLKNALHEQIYSERLQFINKAQEKKDIYFQKAADTETDRLTRLEKDISSRTAELIAAMRKNHVPVTSELYRSLNELTARAQAEIAEVRNNFLSEMHGISLNSDKEFNKLKSEQVTDEMITAAGKKNNLEAFIGGSVINKVGILFLVLGIIAVSRFTFVRLPDAFKGIVMFVLSGAMLTGGELINRKKPGIFSLGLTAGGIAGLFASISISYFALEILGMYPAIILCLLTTAGAFVLSLRHNSQTIAAFAFIGGYLPIASVSDNKTLIYSAMIYFIVLNLLALSISFYKKWSAAMLIGFIFNVPGTVYIVYSLLISKRFGEFVPAYSLPAILHVFFSFTVYTLIPVMGSVRTKKPLSRLDITVLAINTLLSGLMMYIVFYESGLSEFNGLLAVAFAAAYVLLARFCETNMLSETRAPALFYITGLTFAVLVIPFQFGVEWLALGWMVQGTSMAVYGILKDDSRFKKAGIAIYMLCVLAFVAVDLRRFYLDLFQFKYLAVTLGSVLIAGAHAYKKETGAFASGFKYFTIINLWLYLLFLSGEIINRVVSDSLYSGGLFTVSYYGKRSLASCTVMIITLFYALILPRIRVLYDGTVKAIACGIGIIGMLGAAAVSGAGYISAMEGASGKVIASVILAAMCALAILVMKELLTHFALMRRIPAEILPIITSAYFLVLLSQNLITQYGIGTTSIAISLIFIVAALAWIIFGFLRRYAYMRRFGLALSVLAIAKLFLVDMYGMTQGYKIIAYFSFGVTLLGISFTYQYFSKRLIKSDSDGTDQIKE